MLDLEREVKASLKAILWVLKEYGLRAAKKFEESKAAWNTTESLNAMDLKTRVLDPLKLEKDHLVG